MNIGKQGRIQTGFRFLSPAYPDGRRTQHVGARLDVEVKRTIGAIKEGRDEYVEKALEVIKR